VVTMTARSWTLTVSGAPPPGLDWGVQFYRRPLGTSTWATHGSRDTSAPYARSASVSSCAWDTKAVWTRTGSLPQETFRTVEVCQ